MSRSRKYPMTTLSKKWDNDKERSYRRRIKQAVREVEQQIPFDPDADFEDSLKKEGSEYGTKFGWNVPPDESDDTRWHEDYDKAKRK